MRFIEKIQKLPTKTKKLLIFFLATVIGFFLFRNYLINIKKKIELFKEDNLFSNKMENFFEEISKSAKEDLQKIEKSIQELVEKVKESENQKNEAENEFQ